MSNRQANAQPIAIVGMACRFPGAASLPEFWQLLRDGRHAITEIPRDRFDLDALYAQEPATPGHIMTRWGGFLERVEQFDASFFGISPREAERLDPQQRLLLELTAEALDDAGQNPAKVTHARTGVFVGMWLNEYESRLFRDQSAIDFYMTTGTGRYTASGRLSHVFDFNGPSLTVDTACSSSLVAVHLACQSLLTGECDAALVGAANVILEPFITIAYSQSRMMAPDGRCKFGDASADGYVRSDGAAALLLKPLSRALADGDRIYATILGSSVTNDGASSGSLGTPGGHGQREMLRRAYAAADVAPSAVDYIEAHGTGTRAGDPVEIEAIAAVVADGRAQGSPCRVGSVKTNIGHTEGAAGLAGLIKVALSLQHELLPRSLHFETPTPAIAWQELPVVVNAVETAWPRAARQRIAGVSSFGIAGTNAHIVLGESPAISARPASEEGQRVVLFSGHTADARIAAAVALDAWLGAHPDTRFDDLSFTTSVRRGQSEFRAALVAGSVAEVRAGLEQYIRGEVGSRCAVGHAEPEQPRRIAFVFPGQGAQWLGMGRSLLQYNGAFAAELRRCEAAIQPLTGWSVTEELLRAEGDSRLDQIDVVQPLLFAIAVSVSAAWRAVGVEPNAVIGHSMGEVAAAYVAGALSLEDAARIVCRRSALLKRVSGKGAMAVVELPLAEAEAALAGYEDRVAVAVSNSRRSTVLSGDPSALDEILAALEAREVFCRRVKVDVASHSPQMDPLADDLRRALHGLSWRRGAIPIYSTVSATIENGEGLSPDYWVSNLREPVRFSTMASRLLEDGFDTFLEMSPHPLLGGALTELAEERGASAVVLSSGRRNEDDHGALLFAMASAHCHGVRVDFAPLCAAGGQLLSLPSHCFQRERFWYDPPARRANQPSAGSPLGEPFSPAGEPGTTYWQFELSVADLPFLADHRVNGAVVLPAAAFVALALDAARSVGLPALTSEAVQVGAALVLAEGERRPLQIVLTRHDSTRARVKIFGRESAQSGDAEAWVEHASAELLAAPHLTAERPESMTPGSAFDAASHYEAMQRRGLEYGESFRLVLGGTRSLTGLSASIALPAPTRGVWARAQRGTLVLDACLQSAVLALPVTRAAAAADTYLPVSFDSLFLGDLAREGRLTCEVSARGGDPAGEAWAADLIARDAAGEVVVRVENLQLRRIARERDRLARDALYSLSWLATPAVTDAASSTGTWLILGDPALSAGIAAALSARGASTTMGLAWQTAAHGSERWRGIVFAAAPPDPGPLEQDASLVFSEALALSQQLVAREEEARVWFITCGAAAVVPGDTVDGLSGAALWGLRSVLAAEYPRLRASCLDLDSAPPPPSLAALATELLAQADDDEIALRGGARFVRRLAPGLAAPPASPSTKALHRPYRLVSTTRGILDSLALEVFQRPSPQASEIEIEIVASGLNFMNVLGALGAYPGFPDGAGPLGIECAGRVVRIGAEVKRFALGDRVMAFARDSMATHAIAHECLALRVPESLDFEQAATIPIAYLTAHYALRHLARIARGERVLVHSAAGGVGLAALAIARHAGAEVIATVGSAAKRDWLHAQGIEHVSDSRSLAFVDVVRRATGGEGVDVVLNSLAGEAASASLGLLRRGGRFVELGKRDIYDNRALGLLPFSRNLSYFAVDLERMAREEPRALGAVLNDMTAAIESGAYAPLPRAVYGSADTKAAFQAMSAGQHIGKLVVRMDREEPLLRPRSSAVPDWSNGVVLITGGTGGLGLEVARWMIEQGARHLVLTGRRAETTELSALLAPLRTAAVVEVIPADVSLARDVAALFERVDASGARLLGVVHAAGVLNDATLLELDAQRVRHVFAAKVSGALNLHAAVATRELDFFVLFSSVASFLGLSGQANYAAANALLDALAAQRRAAGLAGISIAWGPWADVGLAAERSDRGARLAERGLGSLTPAVALRAFGEVLASNPSHAVVMPFELSRWLEHSSRRPTLFAALEGQAGQAASNVASAQSLRERLIAIAPGPGRRALLEAQLQQLVAEVLRLPVARVDVKKPLRTLGLDSLMGLELRNRLERSFQLKLPATLIWNYPTVQALAGQLATRLQMPLEATPTVEAPASNAVQSAADPELDPLLAELDALSDEEALRLLAGDG